LNKLDLIAIRDSKQFIDGLTSASRTLIGILAHHFLNAHPTFPQGLKPTMILQHLRHG
jgi:hypothetical protein